MRAVQRTLIILCCILILIPSMAFADDSNNLNKDGFSTSYTYRYDYWGDVQESPDAYRVMTVIDSMTLGLENLNNIRIKKAQSLFAIGDELYVCDTGNNRIIQLHRDQDSFSVARIFDTAYSTPEDYELAETMNIKLQEYEDCLKELEAAELELVTLQEAAKNKAPEPIAEAAPAEEATETAAEATSEAAEEIPAEETPAEETAEATGNAEETGEGAETAEEAQPSESEGEEKPAAKDPIAEAEANVAELEAKTEEAMHAAIQAEEYAKEQGCNIWQFEAWEKDGEGNVVSKLNNPNDIAVDNEGNIYIADTNNLRVLKMDKDFNLLWEFTKPLDNTFDQSLDFTPRKVVIDVAGRVYALVLNVNKGIVKYEADGTFTGFIGANPVNVSTAEYIWKRYFQTQAQRDASASFVPTEYENIYIDQDGFIYTTTTNFSEYDLKSDAARPIRRLNGLGSDILVKNDRYPPIGDLWWLEGDSTYFGPSKMVDITVFENDIYVTLDRVRGRLFGYDSQGVMLWAFGTRGNIKGAFTSPVSLEHMGHDLFVLDQTENSITVFTPTEYGNKIYSAIQKYQDGEYDASTETWQDVLKQDATYPMAFRGIGRTELRQDHYEEAMEYFEMAHDRENYGRVFKLYRKEWIEKNIWWIFLIIAVLLIVPLILGRIKKMKWEVIMHEHSKVRK